LKQEFKQIYHSYLENLKVDTNSIATEFCTKISFFEIRPERRKVKKEQSTKKWKFIFTYQIEETFEPFTRE
jgi:hypothetical protein